MIALLAIGGIVIGGAKAQSSGMPAKVANAAGPKKAEEQFKNIQALKGVPADQVFPAMQFITASLGVECQFCHVEGAFEKDDKKTKQTARKMMEMMFAINKDNFEGHREVTCYSCHRGSTTPVGHAVGDGGRADGHGGSEEGRGKTSQGGKGSERAAG